MCREGRIEIAFGAGMQDMHLQPEATGRRLQVLRSGLSLIRIGRRDVAARSGEAGDKSKLDWIGGYLEDDRNRCSRRLGRQRRRNAAGRGNHTHLTTDEL